MTKERIEGALQFKLLLALMEGPSYGADLMKKLNISSSGTIYPGLKTMRQKGLIKYMSGTAKEKKKLYVLSTKGKEQLRRILLGVGRRYFSRFIDPYIQPLVEKLEEIVPACHGKKVLSNLGYEPIRRWLKGADATYLQTVKAPSGSYDFILTGMVATLVSYGWKTNELTVYLTQIVNSLVTGGTLVVLEIKKNDNIFMEMFFKDVLGFGRVPGVTEDELKNLLETHNLRIKAINDWRGLLIGVSTKLE